MTTPRDSPAELAKFYGKVGENQVILELPYPMKLSWDLSSTVTRFSCHKKVRDSLRGILETTLAHYGADAIRQLGLDRFSGCLNVRRKRGGTTWSTHSWGIALDLWDDKNQLKWNHTKAVFARPEYRAFWDAVAGHGWTGLGPARDFDWMHIQAAHL